jgi:hypothetical protein
MKNRISRDTRNINGGHKTQNEKKKYTMTSPKNPRMSPGACTNGEQLLFLIIHQEEM